MWKPSPWGVVKPKTAKVVENADETVKSRTSSSPESSANLKNEIWREVTSERPLSDRDASDELLESPVVEKTVQEALGVPWKSKSKSPSNTRHQVRELIYSKINLF